MRGCRGEQREKGKGEHATTHGGDSGYEGELGEMTGILSGVIIMAASLKKRKISTEPLHTLGGGPRELQDFSHLQLERLAYKPKMPAVLADAATVILAAAVSALFTAVTCASRVFAGGCWGQDNVHCAR